MISPAVAPTWRNHANPGRSDNCRHDFSSGRSHVVSNGMADVGSVAFSRDGQFLYLAASTNAGPLQFGLDMSTQERPYRAGIHALVLAADGQSPLAPRAGDESDEPENGNDDESADGKNDGVVDVRVDLDGLFERMVRSEEHTSELQSRGHLVCR